MMKQSVNPHIICKTLAVVVKKRTQLQFSQLSHSTYALGFKYCHNCDEWFYQPENNCFCCGILLRQKPRAKNSKKVLEKTKLLIKKYNITVKLRAKYPLSNIDFIDAKDALVENFQYAHISKRQTINYTVRRAKIRRFNSLDYKIFRFFKMVDHFYSLAMRPVKQAKSHKKKYAKQVAFKRFWQLVETQ